jgi:4-hydroxy-tetrahydrodipicolinate reductase
MTTIAVTGAAGRMGARIIALARESGTFQVTSAIERIDHPMLGKDAGEIAGAGAINVPLGIDLGAVPQVLIDFSAPASARHWLEVCRQRKIAMLIGTTGLQWADQTAIDQAAADIPILQATNMSVGVALLNRIAAQVARQLGEDYDIEIVEAHHHFKNDAPSGTAMTLADAILEATGKGRDALIYDRHGDDVPRQRGQVGMHSLRMGDEVGRHTAYFAGMGERLELTHRATSRDTFARGALRAAKWLAPQKPGRYHISDVLGL